MTKNEENRIFFFLLGMLAGIICLRCVIYYTESTDDDTFNNDFEYEKESLVALKRVELRNEHFQCSDQMVYWGTDTLNLFPLGDFCKGKKLFFCFSEKTCPPCVDSVVELFRKVLTEEEIKNKVVFLSPDYPLRLRNDCYGKRLLSLRYKSLGLPIELEDSFAPFLFVMGEELQVMYLHIHNKALPQLTLTYLEEMRNLW